MHTNTYKRLTKEDREEISRGLAQTESLSGIAKRLDRPTSTITREVRRNSVKHRYRAFQAQKQTVARASTRRRGKRKLCRNKQLHDYVLKKLHCYWSPEEIVASLQRDYPSDTTMRISHEAIYQYIYVLPRGSLKQELIKALRQEHKYRRHKGSKRGSKEETRGKLSNMLSIEERPSEVADRTIPGHWEGDLILGRYKRTALGTLVERTTRYTLLVPLQAKDAVSVCAAYTKTIKTLPKEIVKTLTYDQGKEMSEHQQFTLATGVKVYFAHPGAPWERGTNENTNGLLRQYFPKGTDFSTVSVREIKRVQRELNDRPRKVLQWKKPTEVINQLVALKG